MRRHMAYQVGEVMPYFIKRYIFFNRNAELRPLYNFDEGSCAQMFISYLWLTVPPTLTVVSISGVPEKVSH